MPDDLSGMTPKFRMALALDELRRTEATVSDAEKEALLDSIDLELALLDHGIPREDAWKWKIERLPNGAQFLAYTEAYWRGVQPDLPLANLKAPRYRRWWMQSKSLLARVFLRRCPRIASYNPARALPAKTGGAACDRREDAEP